MCDKEDCLCEEMTKLGYKPMSGMTGEEQKLLENVVALIQKEFHVSFTARDVSIKKIVCEHCGEEAFCIHFHSEVKGARHPEILVDVDDILEICTGCGMKRRSYNEAYQTNPELRMTNCQFCGRDIDHADLKVFNRTSY